MKRMLLSILGFALAAPAFAQVVPPIPRIPVIVDEPKPNETPPASDDPLATIERITKSARAVGDRLRESDTGADTRDKQDKLLKDIDSLLKNNSPPPPPPMGGGGDPPPMPPMGGGGPPPPPMGGGSKRPRGEGQQPMGGKPMPMPMGGTGEKPSPMPMPMGAGDKPMPMEGGPGGKEPGGTDNKGGSKSKPDLPLDDPFTKQVWGHLPEKLRQQAMQSYKEQFMPRYNELLGEYYKALSDKAEKSQPKK